MKRFKRIFVVVIDSLGIGAMNNAAEYGDEGSDTLGHIDAAVDHLNLPNLEKLGLGNLRSLKHVKPVAEPKAYYGKLNEASVGKDTMTGHWEMMGLDFTLQSLSKRLRKQVFQKNCLMNWKNAPDTRLSEINPPAVRKSWMNWESIRLLPGT